LLEIAKNICDLIGDSSCQFAEAVKWNGFAFQSRREPQTNVVQNEEDKRFCSILRQRIKFFAKRFQLFLAELAG